MARGRPSAPATAVCVRVGFWLAQVMERPPPSTYNNERAPLNELIGIGDGEAASLDRQGERGVCLEVEVALAWYGPVNSLVISVLRSTIGGHSGAGPRYGACPPRRPCPPPPRETTTRPPKFQFNQSAPSVTGWTHLLVLSPRSLACRPRTMLEW